MDDEPDVEELDWDELHDWHPSDRPCGDCGGPTEEGNWWDDHPRDGGANIGTLWRCVRDGEGCGWAESA